MFNLDLSEPDIVDLQPLKHVAWNKGLPQTWRYGHYTTNLEGKSHSQWKEEYGPTAVYHMKKYGHLDNIGLGPGAKKGNTNAKRRLIDGKSVSEWSRLLGYSRKKITMHYEKHGNIDLLQEETA
jgi:hypothetical protein